MMKLNSKAKKASAFLVLALGAFVWANSVSMKDTGSKKGLFRFPASRIFGEERSASVATEKLYAVNLAQVKKRKLASVGHPASPVENFRFGVLEGKYQLTMEGDKVSAVSFIDNPDSIGSPTQLNDRVKFLTSNAKVFGLSGNPERIAVDLEGTHVVETYRVKQPSGNESKIKIILDQSDRLIGLKSEKGSTLKIF